MEAPDLSEAEYVKGFNEGYLIARYEPALAQRIADVAHDSPRLEGFRDGQEEWAIEAFKERYQEWTREAWGEDVPDKEEDAPDR